MTTLSAALPGPQASTATVATPRWNALPLALQVRNPLLCSSCALPSSLLFLLTSTPVSSPLLLECPPLYTACVLPSAPPVPAAIAFYLSSPLLLLCPSLSPSVCRSLCSSSVLTSTMPVSFPRLFLCRPLHVCPPVAGLQPLAPFLLCSPLYSSCALPSSYVLLPRSASTCSAPPVSSHLHSDSHAVCSPAPHAVCSHPPPCCL